MASSISRRAFVGGGGLTAGAFLTGFLLSRFGLDPLAPTPAFAAVTGATDNVSIVPRGVATTDVLSKAEMVSWQTPGAHWRDDGSGFCAIGGNVLALNPAGWSKLCRGETIGAFATWIAPNVFNIGGRQVDGEVEVRDLTKDGVGTGNDVAISLDGKYTSMGIPAGSYPLVELRDNGRDLAMDSSDQMGVTYLGGAVTEVAGVYKQLTMTVRFRWHDTQAICPFAIVTRIHDLDIVSGGLCESIEFSDATVKKPYWVWDEFLGVAANTSFGKRFSANAYNFDGYDPKGCVLVSSVKGELTMKRNSAKWGSFLYTWVPILSVPYPTKSVITPEPDGTWQPGQILTYEVRTRLLERWRETVGPLTSIRLVDQVPEGLTVKVVRGTVGGTAIEGDVGSVSWSQRNVTLRLDGRWLQNLDHYDGSDIVLQIDCMVDEREPGLATLSNTATLYIDEMSWASAPCDIQVDVPVLEISKTVV